MAAKTSAAFFSYSREDSVFALRLAEDLKAAGANVWIDQLDIEPGMPWDRTVEDALNNCQRMLVILSPVSIKSDNVRDEVSFALSKQKRVIPILYRRCDVPFRLARLQHVDFRTDYSRGLKLLLKALSVEQPPQVMADAPPAVESQTRPVASDVGELPLSEEAKQGKAEADRVGTAEIELGEGAKTEEDYARRIESAKRRIRTSWIVAAIFGFAIGTAMAVGVKSDSAVVSTPLPILMPLLILPTGYVIWTVFWFFPPVWKWWRGLLRERSLANPLWWFSLIMFPFLIHITITLGPLGGGISQYRKYRRIALGA